MDVSKSRIFEIQVFVFDCWQISTKWMLENLRLFKSKFSCLTVGGNQKVRLIKVGGKKICDVQDMRVFNLSFAHTKFGLVRMNQVKKGGGGWGWGHFPPLI